MKCLGDTADNIFCCLKGKGEFVSRKIK